ncbi:unnamed protein product [Chrysoparadoxa australica]
MQLSFLMVALFGLANAENLRGANQDQSRRLCAGEWEVCIDRYQKVADCCPGLYNDSGGFGGLTAPLICADKGDGRSHCCIPNHKDGGCPTN